MREILFRAKQHYTKEWLYGAVVKDGDECLITVGEPDGLYKQKMTVVEESTVGQFTGLLDKHGRKIFEGDIVKIYHVRLVFDGPVFPPQLANITWNVDECGFRLEGPEFSSTNPDLYPSSHLEVIGNIHDNKMEDIK